MSSNLHNTKRLTLLSLILMIFTSVFGFTNIPRSYYLMSYAAIPWFILSAITFFIPFAFMMAEFGSAFKTEKGGIYSWMEKSVNAKYAFVGTFMWYTSYVIWMVSICSSIWIPLSNAIYGKDTTASWRLALLNPTQTLGILGIILIIFITFIATKGLKQITKITSIGGTAVTLLNVVLFIGALIVFILNGGKLAEPLTGNALINSPNPGYASLFSVLGFLVYALFAYGGIEAVGGLVDETENPEHTFPKGITVAAVIIAVGYSLGIFFCGTFTNWNAVFSGNKSHIGNVAYVVMNNLGYQIGLSLGLETATASIIGDWLARFVGLSMFLALMGAFFTLSYAPLKQIIEGTPAKLWPGKMSEIKDGMPVNAMWIQCAMVIVFLLLLSLGGESAARFFSVLVNMTNVAMTLPLLFISGAFIQFKKKKEITKPFTVFQTQSRAVFWSIIVTLTIGFANFFTIIAPARQGDIKTTLWMIAGPIFFSILALLMYSKYERRSR
jgi:amino acid transporter